eukprot:TRINITY_DN1317_c0_g1_i2.p1 TRINITY_DN1317_c0_g1~~TRINITY_DN1317_c0_g1_i2.p1  ORF type:complete len:175 (+),score=2.38 TRINITY_DN1317_c0_g1_i2:485-1009(+)
MIVTISNLRKQTTTNLLFNKSVSDISIPIKRRSRQDDPISRYLFNMAIDILNHLILNHMSKSLIDLHRHLIPSLMYCDETLINVKHPQQISQALSILDSFTAFSGLKFLFDKDRLVPQATKFLKDLPLKYYKISKLNPSLLRMKQFTNSYVLSKALFWAQYKPLFPLDWQEVDT